MRSICKFLVNFGAIIILGLLFVLAFLLRQNKKSFPSTVVSETVVPAPFIARSSGTPLGNTLHFGHPKIENFSNEISHGIEPIGLINYDTLKRDSPLMDTQTLHRAVIKRSGVVQRAQTHLSNPIVIAHWVETLADLPNAQNDANLLQRAFIIDALQEAVAWQENPLRSIVVEKVQKLVEQMPEENANIAQLKVLAVEKRELWQIIKVYFTAQELAEVDKNKIESAWEHRMASHAKETQ